jgi:8-amino-7-oxononanoate synthase
LQDPDFLQDRLDDLRDTGQYRELPPDRSGIDFWSNDYLGFSRLLHPDPPATSIAPGSRLISGNHSSITGLEDRIAGWHGCCQAGVC